MIKRMERFLKEIYETIDSYFPYWSIIQIPVDFFSFNFFRISGVYILYSEKEVIYIGCSADIWNRLRSHFGNNSPYKNDVTAIDIIRFRDNEVGRCGVEAELIDIFRPQFNKAYPYGYSIPENFKLAEIIKQVRQRLTIKEA